MWILLPEWQWLRLPESVSRMAPPRRGSRVEATNCSSDCDVRRSFNLRSVTTAWCASGEGERRNRVPSGGAKTLVGVAPSHAAVYTVAQLVMLHHQHNVCMRLATKKPDNNVEGTRERSLAQAHEASHKRTLPAHCCDPPHSLIRLVRTKWKGLLWAIGVLHLEVLHPAWKGGRVIERRHSGTDCWIFAIPRAFSCKGTATNAETAAAKTRPFGRFAFFTESAPCACQLFAALFLFFFFSFFTPQALAVLI